MHFAARTTALILCTAVCQFAVAQITIKDPWVRATVPQQKASSAFMEITSAKPTRLVEARSSITKTVQIHEMTMSGDVMKMREVPGIDVKPGHPLALTPDGYHIMLLDLGSQIKVGDIVPLSLVFESADGRRETIDVSATARPLGAASGNHKH